MLLNQCFWRSFFVSSCLVAPLAENSSNFVFHVHDEVVAEVPKGKSTIEAMNELMSVVPEWAKNLPLGAEGYETDYYKKD